jgi:nucleoid-associated protein YgaU
VAGKLLTSLKSASTAANAISHEAKLGMAVITILFFAFCFLVYHKMDLHQRQLTQASIAAKAGTPEANATPEDASTLMSGNVTGATTDPLLERSVAASDNPNTVMQGDDEVPTFAQAETQSSTPGFGGSAAMEFSEPSESNTTDPTSQPSDLLAENSFPAAVIENREPQESLAELTEPAIAGNAFDAIDEDRSATNNSPAMADFTTLDAAVSGSATPEFGPLESTESVPQPQDNEFPLSALDGTENLPASGRQPSADLAENSIAITLPEASEAGEMSFDSLDASPLNDSAIANESATTTELAENDLVEPPMVEEPAAQPEQEPVLIAMLDPQDGFAGQSAGDAYSDRVSDFAPLDDASDNVESGRNPAYDDDQTPKFGSAAEQEISERVVAQRSSGFGSRGFDAVTQPGGRTNRNSVRTAAGSGADGKFSLAAFNSQNADAEPAPDDGTTYEYTVVKDGENYSKISRRVYGTTRYFSALAVFNQHRIAEPKHMRPGMIVLTPSKEILEERYPQLFVDSKPRVVEPAAFLLLEDGSPAYRVGERETLSEISKRFLGRSSRWVEILRLNQSNVKDPNKLKPGTILALPADATEVNVVP